MRCLLCIFDSKSPDMDQTGMIFSSNKKKIEVYMNAVFLLLIHSPFKASLYFCCIVQFEHHFDTRS